MSTAQRTGPAFATSSNLTAVDTTAQNTVNAEVAGIDSFNGEADFIYLAGCASTIAGSVVTFDEAGATTLLAANAKGPVVVALAATVASTWGWYARKGTFLVDMVANSADNANLGRETTDGKVGDGFATGDMILGMIARGATTTAALQYAQFDHPYVNDQSGA